MITYEHVKLVAEIVAFVSLTGVAYLLISIRRVLREFLGISVVRGIFLGVLIFWSGYLINVLNDIFPLELLKILDDVIATIGIGIIALSAVRVRKQIVMHVKPRVVLDGESGLHRGAYLVKPTSPQMILGLLSGKKVLVVTRRPQLYESLGVPYIWITNVDHPKAISPTRLAPLLHTIIESADKDTFVIFDGLNYLILQNGFESTIKFLMSLKDVLLEKGAGIVLIVDPETLEKKHIAMLEREFKWILK
ncbi:Hypothetical protein TON_1041 [Thermococcus onnurineus NA1]|uniref:DUF835 domain-containing protein n=1 Tax=Thermococcus onnurineus (strain NA1) TaxID=523850 RepID=B6YWR6_THEON|nr:MULTISPECIES: DUF835 domain-containing protein [Thermococcus]ACJ16529.1 Hypothetical protein TON_1041 [Thermococcus onnurineus NA1]NJE47813.1 DUF835 domain-containing protein [Thermococcus sp. GR7]NJE79175.1 DUF835 domain-containing protein [Thermococcus sp. GR4]NJF23426.1 DUF835 domain-containing protein [Thermococcus sp. GR5]